jgi:hypothetical protein
MSRRSRRAWGKRELDRETKARIETVKRLAEAGHAPRAIAPAAKLPEPLVVAMLEMHSIDGATVAPDDSPREGGGGIT